MWNSLSLLASNSESSIQQRADVLYVRTSSTAGYVQAWLSLKRTTNSVSQASLTHVPDGHAPALEDIGDVRSSLMQALGPHRVHQGWVAEPQNDG